MAKIFKKLLCVALLGTIVFPSVPVLIKAETSTKNTGNYSLLNNEKQIEYPANKTIAKSSNSQSGYDASKVLDNNLSTKWEANWNNPPKSVDLTLSTTNTEYFTGFQYVSRQDNNIAGVMTSYKVYISENGVDFSEQVLIEGTFTKKLGTFFVEFDSPVKAKSIKIVTDANAIAEMRLLYIPSTTEDYDQLIALAGEMREEAAIKQGMTEGLYSPDALAKFDEGMKIVTENGKPTTNEEAFQQNQNIFTLYKDLKRSQWEMTADLNKLLRNGEALLNSANVGTIPLTWSQEEVDKYRELIKDIQATAVGIVASRGEIMDAKKRLEDGVFAFERAQIKPKISYTGNVLQPLEHIMDQMTESHFQGSGIGQDKYIELDYKENVQFESVAFQTWWATGQCLKKIAVSYKNAEGDWQNADDGKEYILKYTTNSATSESQKVVFDSIFSGTAIRIHILDAASANYVIDELIVGTATIEENMKITLDKDNVELNEGEFTQLNATVLPVQAPNKKVIWSSSDSAIASVDQDGKVTALAIPKNQEYGEVTISATTEFGSKTATCVVIVKPKVATNEDKENTVTRLQIAQKLAMAANETDYKSNAVKTFRNQLENISNQLNGNITVGEISAIEQSIVSATDSFEEASYIPIQETKKLIDRITGANSSNRFILETIVKDSATGMDVYEIDWDATSNKPILRGSDGVSLATAYNYYLKYFAYLDFPYVGASNLQLPKNMVVVNEKVRIVFPYEKRHYFNENCEYKYTASLYGEEEWQHRLDWMAMNGFNMFLMDMGKHAIWYNAKDELGLNEEAIEELRRSNDGTEQYFGKYSVSQEAIEQEEKLAKKVVQDALKLGMQPEIRPFVGQVPFMFPNQRDDYYGNKSKPKMTIDLDGSKFDGMRLYSGARWMNLPQGVYISPKVDSQDKAIAEEMQKKFNEISDIYYNSLMETLGFNELGRTPQYVYKDLVGEHGFVVDHEAFPKKVLSEMSEQLEKLNPDAIWLQTSWRYQTWLPDYYKDGQLMFIDLAAENRPKWDGNNEFGQTPWLWSMLFNFGGNSGIGGGLDRVASGPIEANEKANQMKGVSISPEGGDTNPALYGLMAEMTWRSTPPDVEQWILDYVKRRYGAENYEAAKPEIDLAWKTLYETIYSDFTPGDGPAQTLVAARPKLTGAIARVYGSNYKLYQTQELVPAWKALLAAAEKMPTMNEQFKYDLVDITRQVLADASGDIYNNIAPSFNAKDKEATLKYADMMVDICNDMDRILGTNTSFLLGERLNNAKGRGVSDSDKAYFEEVERTFLTYWVLDNPTAGDNGGLTDYCNRHLAGLMKDYYGMRWEVFRTHLKEALDNNTMVNQAAINTEIITNVEKWTEERTEYSSQTNGDALKISKELFKKYESFFKELGQGSDSSRDIPLEGMKATAGNQQTDIGVEGPASNVLDDKPETIWHTAWGGSPREDQYIVIELGQEQLVDGLRYLPRTSGSNGIIIKYAIDLSNDGGENFHEVATGNWVGNNTWKTASFPWEKATHVRLRTIDSVSDSDTKSYSSAAEIRITKPAEYSITVQNDGNGSAQANVENAISKTEVTLSATPNEGYLFKEWKIISGDVTIANNMFTMPESDVVVKAVFEKTNDEVDVLVDKLKLVIEMANTILDSSDITNVSPEKIKALTNAVKMGQALLDENSTDAKKLAEAIDNIESATEALQEVIDKASLESLISVAEAVKNSGEYTKDSLASLEIAITNAKAVVNDVNANEVEVREAYDTLELAMHNLKKAQVDKQALANLITQLKELDSDQYTETSVKNLKMALEQAQRVMNNEKATQTEVNECIKALEKAKEALEKKTTNGGTNTGDTTNKLIWLGLLAGSMLVIGTHKKTKSNN